MAAVYFCCTILGVASTGRYPASCPVKPGLSSSEPFRLSSRALFSYSVFCSFQFSEVPLTSFVRLLLFSAFFVFSYKAFLFRLIDLLLFFFSGFFFVLLPILIEHFLFTLISVHISFDSDVFYTCFLSNIRRSPLRLRWTVPPFLRL